MDLVYKRRAKTRGRNANPSPLPSRKGNAEAAQPFKAHPRYGRVREGKYPVTSDNHIMQYGGEYPSDPSNFGVGW